MRKPLQRAILIILLFSIFTLGISLRLQNLGNVLDRSPDELIYTYQAKTIAAQGTEGIRLLVSKYNATENLWKYPPPTRIGYLYLLAAVMKMTNLMDTKAGVYLSCFFSILSLLILIILGLRFFNQWVTLYALLFMSVSPMSLAIARRSWQESLIECIGLLLIYLACKIMRASNRIIWFVLFVLVGSYCMLIKSTGVIIYALVMMWLLWVILIKRRFFSRGFLLMALGAIGAGISIAFLVHATGGIPALKEVYTHFRGAVEASEYARAYASGPWYYFFQMLWMLTPLSTVLFFIGSIGALFLSVDKNREVILGIIFFIAALMAALFIGKEHSLNLRYVGVLYPHFYLISGLGLWYIVLFVRKKLENFSFSIVVTSIIAITIIAAVNDYQNFKRIIVKPGIKDLSIRLLRESSALRYR